jgi:hypothetical protein
VGSDGLAAYLPPIIGTVTPFKLYGTNAPVSNRDW